MTRCAVGKNYFEKKSRDFYNTSLYKMFTFGTPCHILMYRTG